MSHAPARRLSVAALIAMALTGAAFLPAAAEGDGAGAGSVAPVTGFDVDRYLGVWHEIALVPNWFQEDCIAATTATYGLAEEGTRLTVLNSCLQEGGETVATEGRARFTGPADVGALEVTFVDLLGYWLWPLSGDYIVIGLGADYDWAAIGHPSRDYGWILARQERLDPALLDEIEARFAAAGYDTCRLLMSPRLPGDARTPLCARD